MAQPPHFNIEGAIYFVTTRLKDGGRLLSDYEAEVIKRTILELSDKGEIMLYAYTVMPDHIHILLRPINNELSKTMQLIKGRSSRCVKRGLVERAEDYKYSSAIGYKLKYGEVFYK